MIARNLQTILLLIACSLGSAANAQTAGPTSTSSNQPQTNTQTTPSNTNAPKRDTQKDSDTIQKAIESAMEPAQEVIPICDINPSLPQCKK
jgi:hypothetical protein